MRLHGARRINGVAPDIICKFVSTNDTGHCFAGVNSDSHFEFFAVTLGYITDEIRIESASVAITSA